MQKVTEPHPYDLFATLFEYPERDFPAQVRQIGECLGDRYDGALTSLERFSEMLPSSGAELEGEALAEAREVFMRSFDVQATTTLDVGYVMFGDDYKRGELLVNLGREMRAVGVDCGSELADHLPNILRLLARWEDREIADEFVTEILHPVLRKMIGEFGVERMKQRDGLYKKHYKTLIESSTSRATLYEHGFVALLNVLTVDFDLEDPVVPKETCDFLGSIGRELEIEAKGAGEKPAGKQLTGGRTQC